MLHKFDFKAFFFLSAQFCCNQFETSPLIPYTLLHGTVRIMGTKLNPTIIQQEMKFWLMHKGQCVCSSEKRQRNIHRGINWNTQMVPSYGLSVTIQFEWMHHYPMCGFNCNEDEPNCLCDRTFRLEIKCSSFVGCNFFFSFSVHCNNFSNRRIQSIFVATSQGARAPNTFAVKWVMFLFCSKRSIFLICWGKIKTMWISFEMLFANGGCLSVIFVPNRLQWLADLTRS